MVCGTGNLRSLTDGRFAPRSASLASPLQPPQTAFTAVCNYTYFLHKKVLHFPPADDIILLAVKVDGENKNSIWGISTVGSALHSHCRGQRFESAMLHHSPSENTVFGRIFYIIHTKITHSKPKIAQNGDTMKPPLRKRRGRSK